MKFRSAVVDDYDIKCFKNIKFSHPELPVYKMCVLGAKFNNFIKTDEKGMLYLTFQLFMILLIIKLGQKKNFYQLMMIGKMVSLIQELKNLNIRKNGLILTQV